VRSPRTPARAFALGRAALALAIGCAALAAPAGCSSPPTPPPRRPPPAAPPADQDLAVRVVSDQARATLAVVAARKAGGEPAESDWFTLFSSEGYRRLKKREASMGRELNDETFRSFALSEKLAARSAALTATVALWERADARAAARRALAYLPPGPPHKATIYPVIKPQDNSFVFELDRDPAIFLYVDPEVGPEKFENTLAHELHHVGLATRCPDGEAPPADTPEGLRSARRWAGAFGEGLAMLAAAGGPDAHPHAASKPDERARWDADVARFAEDFARLERFFTDLTEGRMREDEAAKKAASFYGVQGPWYTVGWAMAVAVERAQGRRALVDTLCDPPAFLAAYNRAASPGAPRWPAALLAKLKG
jgi:hypothetical protein